MKNIEKTFINNISFEIHCRDKRIVNNIKKSVHQIDKNIENVFKQKVLISKITIEIIDSRKEFDKLLNKSTPNWLVAISDGKNKKIYIMNEKIIERNSRFNFSTILKHEIAHIYLYSINKKIPIWLDEGLALNLSKQKKEHNIRQENWLYFLSNYKNRKLQFGKFAENEGYRISYHIIKDIFIGRESRQLYLFLKNCHKKEAEVVKKFTKKIDEYVFEKIKSP